MRKLFVILILVLPFGLLAQDWTTIKGVDFIPTVGFFTSGGGWRPGNKQFAVNPYDGSIWMALDNEVHGFDSNGNYFAFDYTNVPVFTSNTNLSTFLEFGFTNSSVFAVDRYIGLLRYDGVSWTIIDVQDNGNSISMDQDSVWVAYEGMDFVTWKDGLTAPDSFDGFQRMVSRKGDIWGCAGNDDGFIYRLENGSPTLYNAFTEPYLLDNSNLDFKFAHNTDTLYCAGEQGFSLAYQGAFIDTLTVHNTINMPWSVIREFEFDQNNNIWALFGNDVNDYVGVAHYDQSTNTWDMIYDSSNSPIGWGSRITIDLDGQGNLYVHDRNDIHVLMINNWPQWLDIEEQDLVKFEIYPNPSNGKISILNKENVPITDIEVLDMHGRIVATIPFSSSFQLNQENGIYFVCLKNRDVILGTQKIVLNR